MTAGTIKMTAEQFAMLGEDPPGTRLELVNGEIIVSPNPTPEHANTMFELASILRTHVKQHGLGWVVPDVDLKLDAFSVRRPDILFYTQDRLDLAGSKHLEGLPDLAIEIVSPSSNKTDKADKFRQYAAAGIKHYWIVDPAEEVFEAYTLRDGIYALVARGQRNDVVKPPPFATLEIPLAHLWWRSIQGARP